MEIFLFLPESGEEVYLLQCGIGSYVMLDRNAFIGVSSLNFGRGVPAAFFCFKSLLGYFQPASGVLGKNGALRPGVRDATSAFAGFPRY
jgi:hypothetical protein